jgi:hypothetical protein
MFAMGFPGKMNPLIIWTNGWIDKLNPVIAYNAP